jgi:hypothetical protein
MNRPARILLVDDELAIQKRRYDRAGGGDVAATGRRAGAGPHARLDCADLGPPDIEGTEVCPAIRKESKC